MYRGEQTGKTRRPRERQERSWGILRPKLVSTEVSNGVTRSDGTRGERTRERSFTKEETRRSFPVAAATYLNSILTSRSHTHFTRLPARPYRPSLATTYHTNANRLSSKLHESFYLNFFSPLFFFLQPTLVGFSILFSLLFLHFSRFSWEDWDPPRNCPGWAAQLLSSEWERADVQNRLGVKIFISSKNVDIF